MKRLLIGVGLVFVAALGSTFVFSQDLPDRSTIHRMEKPGPSPLPGGESGPGTPPVGTDLPEKFKIQPFPPADDLPQIEEAGPKLDHRPFQPTDPCVGPEGKLLANLMDVSFAAKATSPFSVELTWVGPPALYSISGGVVDTVGQSSLKLQVPDTPVLQPGGKVPLVPPDLSKPTNFTYRHERPRHPVLPDFSYGYTIKATLPDGRQVCKTTGAKTLPATISPLPSTFVSPSDIRLGFARPPYAQEINVYRIDYVEDGRQPPFNKRVFQEVSPGQSNIRQINPGLPPVPTDYTKPIVYDFVVETIWRDDVGRTSKAQLPIRMDGPLPLWGWADLHTHLMSHLAFGGKIFHGAPDEGSLLPALSMPVPPPPVPPGAPTPPAPPYNCRFLPGMRASSINEALADDSPTHGDPAQSVCGDVLRKVLITAMEQAKRGQPGRRSGVPSFDAWPKWSDVTHQKMWWQWIKRAYDGGLRVMVALSHNNRLLGDVAKGTNCPGQPVPVCIPTGDKASSDLQVMEIKSFVQRHSQFMQVATAPDELYQIVMRDNKMAVVLGVEIDNIGDLNQLRDPADNPRLPTYKEIRDEIQRLYDQGVRYIFPIHVTDNVFGGTAPYNALFDAANYFEARAFWDVECAGTQPYPNDDIGFETPHIVISKPWTDVFPWLMKVPTPTSPQNCPNNGRRNKKGLNMSPFSVPPPGWPKDVGIGEFAIKEMMKLGMIIDIDHMSHRTVEDVLFIAESIPGGGYPLMSGHSGIRDRLGEFKAENSRTRAQLDRIGCLGGMFGLGTDHAEPRNWAVQYQEALNIIRLRAARCPYKELGLGAVAFGTDANSIVETPKPLLEILDQQGNPDPDRQLNVYNSVVGTRFPMSGAPKIGTQVWDFRTDGVAHYGMFADFVKAVWSLPFDRNRGMMTSGQELVERHLDRNADNFWRMWVKVEAQKKQVQ